jgi:hypothetical protein
MQDTKRRARISPSFVIATLALVISTSAGAYAAVNVAPKNSVVSKSIKNGEVKSRDLAKNSVNAKKIKDGQVGSAELADGGVAGVDIGDGQVGSADIADLQIGTSDFADLSVTSGKLAANAVTTTKIADNAVTGAKIADSSVTSADVLDGTLNDDDLATNSVGVSEIQTDAVQASEIADNSIDSGEIVDFGLSNQDIGVLTATVNADGTLANSSGGVTTLKLPVTGQYEVDFGRNISFCAFVATVAPAGGGTQTGFSDVADRAGNLEAVFVETRDVNGALADRGFHLIVVC